ncbi:MAG: entericidin A/B family lipoprotein [Nitrospirota bacterium]
MRKIVVTIMVVLFLTVLAGCNTMHGFGKDMKKLGKKIEDKAE